MSKFGEEWTRGFRDMLIEAGSRAVEDAKLSGSEIDAMYVGTMATGSLVGDRKSVV